VKATSAQVAVDKQQAVKSGHAQAVESLLIGLIIGVKIGSSPFHL
jgi:hypothetical protein